MSNYSSSLRDPRWQKKRLEMQEAAGWMCVNCGNKDQELHVHHLVYRHDTKPWEYDNDEMVVLCKDCHEEYPEWEAMLMKAIAKFAKQSHDSSILHDTFIFLACFMQQLSANEYHNGGGGIRLPLGPEGGHMLGDIAATMRPWINDVPDLKEKVV